MIGRLAAAILAAGAAALAGVAFVVAAPDGDEAGAAAPTCESAGLTLPPGFCATVFADGLGHARHMAVAVDGTLYVNTWSGAFYRSAPPSPPGGFLVALRDEDGDGKAEVVRRFGPTAADGAGGGTGIALYNGALYAEVDDRIVRYPRAPGEVVPSGAAATTVSGLPMTGDHQMHPFAIDRTGALFVNSGSPSNVCEDPPRAPGSKGKSPCDELATRAGIWKYDAARTGQVFAPKDRFAIGIRNTGGIAFDAAGRMFATQHGRDQLPQNWPQLYDIQRGSELPAEELVAPVSGGDFGWPYCYFDGVQDKLVLAPEYGGDGRSVSQCAQKTPPVAAFPAHWAPNDVLVYGATQFPAAYRGGAFIAFHGSWNRAPTPQQGFNIVFQPLRDGKAAGKWLLFADGFAGPRRAEGTAEHRPAGLAVAPDGALYVADDQAGRIWRISYRGPATAPLTPAMQAALLAPAPPPGGPPPPLTPPSGFTAAQVALGDRIYHGAERDGTCAGCHGGALAGGPLGPKLTGPDWLWADGSVQSIARMIAAGVPKPKRYAAAMPPKGGAPLSAADVDAVAAYVWAAGRAK